MFIRKAIKRAKLLKLSMRSKLTLSLLSIAAVLLISSVISVMEFSRMNNYVSGLIADDISSINVANRLADMTNTYNLELLARIGEGSSDLLPNFDYEYFRAHCDTLRMSSDGNSVYALADSVMYSYAAYMLTSREVSEAVESDFIDSREWYFNRLQPRFDRLRNDISLLSYSIHEDLRRNSATFDRGFYRSIVPGMVAVGVGLLLVLMLLFFMLSYYVKPLRRMLDSLSAYRANDKKYTVSFDGDDELKELNDGISELVSENQQLRRRIKDIRK